MTASCSRLFNQARVAAIVSFLFSLITSGAVASTVATPVFSPTAGTSYVQFNVAVSDATGGATIYYTLDGSTPTTSSSTVTSGGTISILKSATLKAYAVAGGYSDSAVASASYQVTGQVAAGQYHTVLLKSDGTVWTSGYNNHGQLGDNTTTTRAAPVQVTSLSGIVEVGAGAYHSVALKSDGTVWAWGLNSSSQVGDNTTTERHTPVQVKKSNGSGGTTGLTNIVAISVGGYHNFAIDGSGTIWAWGLNSSGQLGDGTTTRSGLAEPLTTLSGVTVQQIFSGEYHSFFLTSTGGVWATGLNTNGQLGDGTTTQRNSPVSVSGLSGVTITQLSGAAGSSLALQSDGTVWGWGYNTSGEVGDGSTTQRTSPVHLSSLSGIVAVQAGYTHSSAIKSDGTVWTWGTNSYGELGDGTIILRSSPVQVSGMSGALQLASGNEDTLVLKSDGTLWGWGYNALGELANGTSAAMAAPSPLLGLNSISQLAMGDQGYHTLFIGAGGAVYATGLNCYGELGDGTTNFHVGATAVNMSNLGSAVACAVGRYHSLAVKSDGTVWAWGLNGNGQLGTGTTTNSSVPVQVSGLTGVTSVAAGATFSMALKSDGTLWGWGSNGNGYLGIGSYTQHTTPVQVRDSGTTTLANVKQVGCGGTFCAALKTDGTVWVWGVNTFGEMTGNSGAQQLYAVKATDTNDPSGYVSNVAAIAVSGDSVMALKNDGTVSAWGCNDHLQIGPNSGYQTNNPVAIPFSSPVTRIAIGNYTGFAQTNDGKCWSWGDSSFGQLGDGTLNSRSSVLQFMAPNGIVALSAGSYFATALKEDGTVFAWGSQNQSQCGAGINYNLPSAAPGFNAIASVPVPTLSITAPANNATLALGSSQTFTASASETGGTIASVSYYVNATLIGTSTTGSSYSLTWTPSTWGNYTFTALATDTTGHTSSLSTPVTVQVPYDSDSNSLPDWWELEYLGSLGNSTTADPDGDGLTNLQEYQQGSDPTNYYSQGAITITPTLTLISGNNQTSAPGQLTAYPLVLGLSHGGTPLVNAPVAFNVTSGGGLLLALAGSGASSFNTVTDASGHAQVYYQNPAAAGTASTIGASAGGQSTSFTSSTSVADGTFDAPTNLAATYPSATEVDLTWTNNATTATGILIEQSTDNIVWTTTATLTSPGATSYAVTGLTSGQTYNFRVAPTK